MENATTSVGERSGFLRRGDQVPHFDVMAANGSRVRYADIWQHRNLVLIALDSTDDEYVGRLMSREPEFIDAETAVVVTSQPVPGAVRPGVTIADRWGEIAQVFPADQGQPLPEVQELLDWINFIRMKCPECPP